MLRSLCLAALLAGLAPPAVAGPCPVMTPEYVVITPPGTALADGGGIVVAQLLQFNGDRAPHGVDTAWRFADGSKPAIVALAPGLDLLVAPAGASRLDDAKHGKVADIAHAATAPAELAAPAVKAARRTDFRAGSHSSSTTTAELAAVPPKGALALVVFDKAGKVARSWGTLGGGTSIAIYASGACGQPPTGLIDSPAGDEIRLAWVDTSGRLSKLSAPVAIAGPTGSHP